VVREESRVLIIQQDREAFVEGSHLGLPPKNLVEDDLLFLVDLDCMEHVKKCINVGEIGLYDDEICL
jgi:hypothetical protein